MHRSALQRAETAVGLTLVWDAESHALQPLCRHRPKRGNTVFGGATRRRAAGSFRRDLARRTPCPLTLTAAALARFAFAPICASAMAGSSSSPHTAVACPARLSRLHFTELGGGFGRPPFYPPSKPRNLRLSSANSQHVLCCDTHIAFCLNGKADLCASASTRPAHAGGKLSS